MSTVSDIVNRALKRVDITGNGETAAPDDAAYALDSLNEMMAGWAAQGVDVNHNDLALGDTFPLEDKHKAGVIAMLACELANDYSMPISAGLDRDRRAGWLALQADYVLVEPMRVDASLARTPSQRHWDG